MHACILSLFFLCPRYDDVLNLVYVHNYIADNVEYYIGIGNVHQLPLDGVSTSTVSKCCTEGRRRQGLGGLSI